MTLQKSYYLTISNDDTGREERPHNSTYKKLAVQWLNEALCFVSSSVVADSFRLRNRQLLVAANRYASPMAVVRKRTFVQETSRQNENEFRHCKQKTDNNNLNLKTT
jgi:hypothetical protein